MKKVSYSNSIAGYIIVLMIALLFSSCMVKQDMLLKVNGAGTMELKVRLGQVFVDYLFDMAEATTDVSSFEEFNIFDVYTIRKTLNEQPGMKVGQIMSVSKDSLVVTLTYEEIQKLSKSISPGGLPLISFSEVKGGHEFRFHLDKKNWKDIKKLFPLLDDPIFENLEPNPEEEVTRDEYLDIVEFALDAEGRQAVLDSFIEVNLQVEGKIISHEGGVKEGNSLKVKIPLIDVLLLNKSVDYAVVFK